MHGQRSRALAVSTAMCFPCGCSDPARRSQAHVPQGSGSAAAEAFSLPSPDRFSAPRCGFFRPDQGTDTAAI